MSQIYDWSNQLRITQQLLMELEHNYKDKRKGAIYAKRKIQLTMKVSYIKNRVLELGVKYNIVKCNYHKNETGYKGYKYEVYFTNISITEARALVQLREPEAWNITTVVILPGVSSTVK